MVMDAHPVGAVRSEQGRSRSRQNADEREAGALAAQALSPHRARVAHRERPRTAPHPASATRRPRSSVPPGSLPVNPLDHRFVARSLPGSAMIRGTCVSNRTALRRRGVDWILECRAGHDPVATARVQRAPPTVIHLLIAFGERT
jgi:hypothetical protein